MISLSALVCKYGFYMYDMELTTELARHNVTWSRKDSFCADQYVVKQPEELPTSPVRAELTQKESAAPAIGFRKFAFNEKVDWDD